MMAILWSSLWNKRYTFLAYCLGELGMVWFYVALFPTISELSGSYNQILESFPPEVLQAFGFEGSFEGFESYLAAEHYGIIWPIVLVPLLASLTGSAIVKEIESGTIELVLAMPVSRGKIFAGKYVAGVIGLLIFILFSVLSTIPFAYLYDITFTPGHLFSMSLLGLLFGMALFSIGMLCSAYFSDRSKAYGLLGGTVVAMYFIKIIALLNDNISFLKYLSFFYYFNVSEAITTNTIELETFTVFLGVTVIASILAWIRFTKRDVAV